MTDYTDYEMPNRPQNYALNFSALDALNDGENPADLRYYKYKICVRCENYQPGKFACCGKYSFAYQSIEEPLMRFCPAFRSGDSK